MIREQGAAAEGNAQCHDQVRGQPGADDGPGYKAIHFARLHVAVGANEATQHSTKTSGARIVSLYADVNFASLCKAPLTPALAASNAVETVQAWRLVHGVVSANTKYATTDNLEVTH
jgi:hypothetical protein